MDVVVDGMPCRTDGKSALYANCLLGRWQGLFVAAPCRAGQCFRQIIALQHLYSGIVAVLCEREMGVASILAPLASYRAIVLGRQTSFVEVGGSCVYLA